MSSNIRAVVAYNIRARAERAGTSLNRLADLAGVSRSQLYNVLAEDTGVTLDWLARIADALGTTPAEMLDPIASRTRSGRRRRRALR